MLILTRHVDESVIIDLRFAGLGLVEIVPIRIGDGKCRIGVTADERIHVDRYEVFLERERERQNPHPCRHRRSHGWAGQARFAPPLPGAVGNLTRGEVPGGYITTAPKHHHAIPFPKER